MREKDIEALTADAELWESRKLGASAKYVQVVSDKEEREIDAALGLQLISIRLSKQLIGQLKELAKLQKIGYQPLIRLVLTEYTKQNDYKLTSLLSATKAAKRGEGLFTEAIKCAESISTFAPLSNQRIRLELNYANALVEAENLFMQAHKHSSNLALKRHAKLRLDQIKQLAQQDFVQTR